MAAKSEPKVNVVLQFDGKSVDVADVSKAAKEDWKAERDGTVSQLHLYLKSEESKAYYVINGKDAGVVDM